MCHDRSWFTAQDSKDKAEKLDTKDKRSETVETLLRESRDHAQKATTTERKPAQEPVPAK